ncbi:MAG: TonB-dependent receptor [Rhodospirillaceae bacterium]|nr:TonB-dependent receptor [Rhodospirillaceae bacterium]
MCRPTRLRRTALSGVSAIILAVPGTVRSAELASADEIVVIGKSISDSSYLPTTTESVTAETLAKTTNVLTPEDAVRYLPNIVVRQRHVGDTQSPVTTRTSGVGASARSLIYVDGMLISALIGNNNTSASPKWGLISPDAVERVDVLYGPFAAAYAGNSIGAVVAFTTRMPEAFEASVQAQGALQWFANYGDDSNYGTWRLAANIGDRAGNFSYRFSYNHLDNAGQPLAYATAAMPVGTSTAGTGVTGAFNDANRAGARIVVLGATGIEHQIQDNLSGRASYEFESGIAAAYTFGLFINGNDSAVNSYLRDAGQNTIHAGTVNIGGRAYTLAASTFSNGIYRQDEQQLAQGLSVTSHNGGMFDFEVVGTAFDYLKSHQRIPSGALPAALTGGAGATTNLDGTGWYTLDLKGILRPLTDHVLTFGAHQDRFKLRNPRYVLADWVSGGDGARLSGSYGKTRTQAVWFQEQWNPRPTVEVTAGVRYERWKAFEGFNISAAPALNVTQPEIAHDAVSPKGVLSLRPAPGWEVKGAVGLAYRFPTVTELYQAIATGTTLSVPNPSLKPERALSSEISAERSWSTGSIRVSVFDERIRNTLLSQTAPLPAGSTTLANYVQNVDRTHASGVELVVRQRNLVIPGFELSGWVTYVRAKVDADAVFPAAVGKNLPQVPRFRGAMVAAYAPNETWAFSAAARYGDRSFATLDNSDPHANTFQGFGAYLVADVHARYRFSPHLAGNVGINNINDRSYFLFHPFPQRTLVADLRYTY